MAGVTNVLLSRIPKEHPFRSVRPLTFEFITRFITFMQDLHRVQSPIRVHWHRASPPP